MAWNPYQDQKNRAYSSIVTTLFPEQTKTMPRIIAWSIIFLLDLIGVIGSAFYFGLIENFSKIAAGLLIIACIALFWLQGRLWYAVAKLFTKKEETWL